ncbi:MAG TPA: methyltransferase domain-containing protein [Cellvibrionaceae bacterium]
MTNNTSPLASPLAWNLVAPGYTELSLPLFEAFARDALALGNVQAEDTIADIATGPGTLALCAAEQVTRVDALDFSTEMLSILQTRIDAAGVDNIYPISGDGQELPYADQHFNAAFSLFGLMFFPDRARGFSELYRVLKPGGRAIVSSWQLNPEQPIFNAVFESLREALPDMPKGGGKPPLSEADDFMAEMSAAGFNVSLHGVTHSVREGDIRTLWRGMLRSFAPLVLLKHNMGDAFAPVADAVEARLAERFTGPVSIDMPAWLAVGER